MPTLFFKLSTFLDKRSSLFRWTNAPAYFDGAKKKFCNVGRQRSQFIVVDDVVKVGVRRCR